MSEYWMSKGRNHSIHIMSNMSNKLYQMYSNKVMRLRKFKKKIVSVQIDFWKILVFQKTEKNNDFRSIFPCFSLLRWGIYCDTWHVNKLLIEKLRNQPTPSHPTPPTNSAVLDKTLKPTKSFEIEKEENLSIFNF